MLSRNFVAELYCATKLHVLLRMLHTAILLHKQSKLECGSMPNVMAALPNIRGALCSTPQSFADAQYYSAVQ